MSKSRYYSYGAKVPSKYLNYEDLDKEYYIICWAASYMGSVQIFSECVTPEEARSWDDRRILERLHELMDSADIIAGHNVDAYDKKRVNTRFLLNGYEKPRTFRTLDTLKMARKYFSFQSNKLEFISLSLGFNPKKDMELDDWIQICMNGDEERIEKMRKYNIGDVREGKKVLEKFLPWVHPFPICPRGGYKAISQ